MNRISKGILYIISILNMLGICFIYPELPKRIPIRWDINWQVRDWTDKKVIFLLGLFPIILLLLISFLPKKDRKKETMKQRKAYGIVAMTIVLFLIVLVWITIAAALEIEFKMQLILPSILGVLLIIFGNYMPIIRSNYYFGIRNPWTLSNEKVWRKTHRVGGYVFAIIGVVMIIASFAFKDGGKFSFVVLIAGLIGVNLYSFILSKKVRE